jgi:magnesium transporter
MAPDDAGRVAVRLPARTLARLAEKLAPAAAARIVARLEPERGRKLLEDLPLRSAASVLHHVDEAARETLLAGMSERSVRALRELLLYPAETAGGMMDTRISSIPVDLTVAEAIATLRKAPRSTLYYLYVIDRDGRLAGVLNMRELLLAMPRDPIASLVRREVVTLPATATREEVAETIGATRFVVLPVVDAEGRLVGVVQHDQALDAIREEAFSDLQRMVGAGGDERALSPVSVVVRKRLPWLYVNLLTAFVAAAVVGLFEGTIAQVTALAVLLPVVAGQGGNTGAQTLAVVMRGIALREVLPGSGARLVWKELQGAVVNGLAVAVGTAAVVLAWDGRLALALVIGLAMVVNMACAGFSGALIPLGLRALGRDPAQSSSIFLTTVTDVVGFASFLGFAVLFLPLLSG